MPIMGSKESMKNVQLYNTDVSGPTLPAIPASSKTVPAAASTKTAVKSSSVKEPALPASVPVSSAASQAYNQLSFQMPEMPTFEMPDYAGMLSMAQAAASMARAQAIEAAARGYESRRGDIKKMADDARSQAYTNSRLSAIGNNEVLAAQGLAGNAYAGPVSGYSETSRVAQDNNMRTNIQSATDAEFAANAELDRAISALRANGQMAEAEAMAANAQQYVQIAMQQQQMKNALDMQAWELNWQMQKYNNDYALGQQQASQNAAWNKAQVLGGYGDFSGYSDMGWDVSKMQAAYNQSYNSKAGNSYGGTSNSTYAQVATGMYNSSDPLAYLMSYGGSLSRTDFNDLYDKALESQRTTLQNISNWLSSMR